MTSPSTLPDTEPFDDSFAVNGFGDRYLYRINRESFNQLGSAAVFQAYFGERLFAEHTLHVVVGTDSGLLLRHIAGRGVATGSRYLFIEPEPVLERLQAEGLAGLLGEKGLCVAPEQWVTEAMAFKINEYFYINSVEFWQSLGARDANLAQYTELVWAVDAELARLHWLGVTALGNEAFIECQLANLADNLHPATLLKNAFRGRTALLLAGGPSLDEILPWAFEHRDRLVVMAVSRISRRLQQVGLVPDFVFSVDPTELSFDVSKEMLEFGDDVTLIHAYHVTPLLLGQWRGPSFYLGQLLPWKSPLNPVSLPHPGPTVTNTALAVGQALGFSRIVLGGVDLCFSRDGFTHAAGSNERKAGPRFDLTGLQVETNGGWMADTSPDFAQARINLEQQAMLLARLGCELVNPSAASARVDRIRYCPLEELGPMGEPLDLRALLEPIRSRPVDRHGHVDALLREIRRGIHNAKAIRDLAIDGLGHNLGIYRTATGSEARRSKIRLDRVERQLNTRYRLFARLTKRLGIRDFLKVTRPFEDAEMDASDAQQLGAIYYEAYRDGAGRLLKLLEATEQRLLSRLAEDADSPDFPALFAQWRKDRQFGRGRVWRRRHPEYPLKEETRREFDDLDQAYREVLDATGSKHLERAKRHSSLAAAQTRARILLRNRQIAELRALGENLENHPEAERGLLHRHLVAACLAEAEGDYDRALQQLQPIIEAGPSPLLEDALMRVFLISLEVRHPGNAGFALQCLSQLSPVYQPKYAEILKLLNRPLEAVDAYNAYLLRFPQDLYAHLKAARLYLDMGAEDACALLVGHILQKWPDNATAREFQRLAAAPDKPPPQ
jgi:hypothetical protein